MFAARTLRRTAGSAGLFVLACGRPSDTGPGNRAALDAASSSSVAPRANPAPSAAPSVKPAPEPEASTRDEPPERGAEGVGPSGFIVDEAADVAPAGAAAATPDGVVMVGRAGEAWLLPLKGKLSRTQKASATPVARLEAPETALVPSAPPPAVLAGSAYFALGGKLVRRAPSPSAPLETLEEGPGIAGRVAAPVAPARPVVAFLARAGDHVVARLWAEGSGSRDLSPEGAAASSVALIGVGQRLLAISIEGRSGMTPLHVRPVELTPKGVVLGEDEVVWVGGPAERYTSVAAVARGAGEASAFVPIARGVTEFGLARVPLEGDDKGEASWRIYPNGVDPAPVGTARGCGEVWVAYVRPAEAAPRSPQQLHLASVGPNGLGPSIPVAFARTITSVAVAEVEGGLLLSYVADARTWAMTLRCAASPPAKPGASAPKTSGSAAPKTK